MTWLQVRDWSRHQHYKDRSPPWIKLHVAVLNDMEFMELSPDSKCLLMLLWILAAENEGKIRNNIEYMRFRLRWANLEDKDIQVLVTSGFLLVDSPALADASRRSPETETETETDWGAEEEERKRKRKNIGGKTSFSPPTTTQVNEYAKEIGFNLNAGAFCDYYEARGWMVGKNKMKSWKAAVRTWRHHEASRGKTQPNVLPFRDGNERECVN